jgi:uncharacterized membrane protein
LRQRDQSRADVLAPPAWRTAARLWEIDALRGLVVVLMVVFHVAWDLSFFRLAPIDIASTPWQAFARSIGATFTFLLGLSLSIRVTRGGAGATFGATMRRGLTIFGLGMVITVVTYVAIGEAFVVFGILHLLGLALILAYPFVHRSPWLSVGLGVSLFVLGTYLNTRAVPVPWLIWLGVPEVGRDMVDYYPLLPWFGVALLGVAAGRWLYPRAVRAYSLPDLGSVRLVRGLRFLGRHSLVIYLLHQPILLGLLVGLGFGSL